mgnify:FL=1
MRRLFGLLLVLVLLLAGAAWWWVNHRLNLTGSVVDLAIEPGTSPRAVAQAAVEAGVETSPLALYWWFRLSGQARLIKAGSYEFEGELTPASLLSKLVRGDEALRAVTLVEGWTFRQVRAALRKEEHLAQDTQGLEPDFL